MPIYTLFDMLPKEVQKQITKDFRKIARQDNNKMMISRAELQEHIAKELKKGVKEGCINDLTPIMDSVNNLFSMVDTNSNGLDLDEYTLMFAGKYLNECMAKGNKNNFGNVFGNFGAPAIPFGILGGVPNLNNNMGSENFNDCVPNNDKTPDQREDMQKQFDEKIQDKQKEEPQKDRAFGEHYGFEG